MALEKYRKKRKFDVTAEPRGGKIKRGGDASSFKSMRRPVCIMICGSSSTA